LQPFEGLSAHLIQPWLNTTERCRAPALQVSLCLLVGCIGISIVWSALCPFTLSLYHPLGRATQLPPRLTACLFLLPALLTLSVWLYYAITADALTSVAHALAALLGCALARAVYVCHLRHVVPTQML
jgi:hypothetical protein